MNILEVDSRKLQNIVTDLSGCIDNYSKDITVLFDEISKLEDVWMGPDAELFINNRLDEKVKYLELAMVLKEYEDCLGLIIEKTEDCIL